MKTLAVGPSRELVGAGKSVGSVTALCFGSPVEDLGADEVLVGPEADLAVVEAAVREARPDLILFAADSFGRDVAPRLAWRLKAGLVTDCIGWDEELRFHRPVYGGKAVAVFTVHSPMKVAVVRSGAFPAAPPAPNPVRRLDTRVPDAPLRVVEHVKEAGSGPSLADARVVVSGGRGLGDGAAFKQIEELAAVLGAAVGASRAAVDEGWVPASWQIGQTGKSVRPELYVAVGISGASQHMAGVTAAKHIVAINSDGDAPIFETARLGVVGDYREVLPALTAALKEVLGG